MLLSAVGKHRPNFRSTTVLALEDDVPPIRRPRGEILPPRIMRELGPAFAGNVHDVNVLAPRGSRTIFAVPGKRQKLSVRRPGRRGGISAVGHALHASSIRSHDV